MSKRTQEIINNELAKLVEKDIKAIKEFKNLLTEEEKNFYNKLIARFEETEREIKRKLQEKKQTLEEEQEKTLEIIKEMKYLQDLGELILNENEEIKQETKKKQRKTLKELIIWFLIGALAIIFYKII